jgi:hypothetical protein
MFLYIAEISSAGFTVVLNTMFSLIWGIRGLGLTADLIPPIEISDIEEVDVLYL